MNGNVLICGAFTFPVCSTRVQVAEGSCTAGSVLPDLSAMVDLREVLLNENGFQGTIPDPSGMTQLRRLYLANNALTGTIPSGVSTLTSLQYLSLAGNSLTGQLPELSSLTQLVSLFLADNHLSGPVPDFSPLTNLRYILLANNNWDCPLDYRPFARWNDYYSVAAASCAPPTAVATPADVIICGLSFPPTATTVEVPPGFCAPGTPVPSLATLTHVEHLFLHDNQLTGSVSLYPFAPLRHVFLDGNNFTGPVPDVTHMAELDMLYIARNTWDCPVPDYSSWAPNTDAHLSSQMCAPPRFSNQRFVEPTSRSSTSTNDADACALLCDDYELCASWTWWYKSKWCNLYLSSANKVATSHMTMGGYSVHHRCKGSRKRLFISSDAANTVLSQTVGTDEHDCCDHCLSTPACAAFEFNLAVNTCTFFSAADGAVVSTPDLSIIGHVER